MEACMKGSIVKKQHDFGFESSAELMDFPGQVKDEGSEGVFVMAFPSNLIGKDVAMSDGHNDLKLVYR